MIKISFENVLKKMKKADITLSMEILGVEQPKSISSALKIATPEQKQKCELILKKYDISSNVENGKIIFFKSGAVAEKPKEKIIMTNEMAVQTDELLNRAVEIAKKKKSIPAQLVEYFYQIACLSANIGRNMLLWIFGTPERLNATARLALNVFLGSAGIGVAYKIVGGLQTIGEVMIGLKNLGYDGMHAFGEALGEAINFQTIVTGTIGTALILLGSAWVVVMHNHELARRQLMREAFEQHQQNQNMAIQQRQEHHEEEMAQRHEQAEAQLEQQARIFNELRSAVNSNTRLSINIARAVVATNRRLESDNIDVQSIFTPDRIVSPNVMTPLMDRRQSEREPKDLSDAMDFFSNFEMGSGQ